MFELVAALAHLASMALLVAAFAIACRTHKPPGPSRCQTAKRNAPDKPSL